MRQLVLIGVFSLGLLGLTGIASAQKGGGTNSVTCEAWFSQPNVPKQGQITLVYYGKWTVDPVNWKGERVETDRGDFQNGQWVTMQGSTVRNQLQVDPNAKLGEFGTYGTAPGNPVPPAGITITTYQQGATVNVRAQLLARPANNPNAPPVVVASAIQTLTMP